VATARSEAEEIALAASQTGNPLIGRLYANKAIAANEELLTSYIKSDLALSTRQDLLWSHYRFKCACPKCLEGK
jgi:hypothetical protein